MFKASRRQLVLTAFLVALIATGCSVRKFAINMVGDALAEGTSTYATDDDLELVGDALPFGLKLIESLLAESPDHEGMLLAACRGFVTYSYVYVQQEAELAADFDLARSRRLRERTRRLYDRAGRHGLHGLDVAYQGILEQLESDPEGALAVVKERDVPLLYWNAAALGLAISVAKNDAAMLARIPEVEAMLDRAMQLDEAWDGGSLHEFEVVLAGAKPGAPDYDRIRQHFERAVELSEASRASLFVAYAESVAVPRQDRKEFRAMLERALAVDADQYEEVRLLNLVAQRRARWLMSRIDDLILEDDTISEGGMS
jgi:predicted anti-sigma-YlaC factor YlaD